ncbi:MAG TPA: hypothetical protein VF023_08670 [Bryobacteraceae bacterium]
MTKRSLLPIALALLFRIAAPGQEAASGVSVPVTLSGSSRAVWAPSEEGGEERSAAAGFRAVLSPTLKLGSHWFAYAALDVHSSKYFSYYSEYDEQPVETKLMQAFVGYSTRLSGASVLVKAGRLSSAFGLFPIEYDDAKMPLIDAPPLYTNYLPLRPDQLPCNVNDILRQTYGSEVEYGCGGQGVERYGMAPVSLFGLPAVEVETSFSRIDGRLQITNSSPANPQSLTAGGQFVQWTAGAGYTLPGGLHLGVSGFRGPYLDHDLNSLLPPGKTIRDYPASAIGIDAEWSRGAWSLEGEWQHYRFALPGFSVSPSENGAYGQAKWIVSPRLFLAMRASALHFGRIQDSSGLNANLFAAPQQVYEVSAGYRLNRRQLLKFGAGWTNGNSWAVGNWLWPQTNRYQLEAQLVTSFTAISKAFR